MGAWPSDRLATRSTQASIWLAASCLPASALALLTNLVDLPSTRCILTLQSSPEVLLGARCTSKSDVYSYGVVLWEIVTGQVPVRGQLRDVQVPGECPDEVRRLILDCLEQNPKRRPTAIELVERLRKIPQSPLEYTTAHATTLVPPQQRGPAATDNSSSVGVASELGF